MQKFTLASLAYLLSQIKWSINIFLYRFNFSSRPSQTPTALTEEVAKETLKQWLGIDIAGYMNQTQNLLELN